MSETFNTVTVTHHLTCEGRADFEDQVLFAVEDRGVTHINGANIATENLHLRASSNGQLQMGHGVFRMGSDTSFSHCVHLDTRANLTLGGRHRRDGTGDDGDIMLTDEQGNLTIGLNGGSGHVRLGKNGKWGGLYVHDDDGRQRGMMSAQFGVETEAFSIIDTDRSVGMQMSIGTRQLRMWDSATTESITLDAEAAEIRLRGGTTVPDYVFEPNYPLADLDAVAEHIDREGHLPDVPSAARIAEDGLELGSFALTLLRKVEELTLHAIAQQRELTQLRQRLGELESRSLDQ